MNDILKQRLVGALILVALGVVFWPIIFVQPADQVEIQARAMPPQPAIATDPIAAPNQSGLRGSRELAARSEEAREKAAAKVSAAVPKPAKPVASGKQARTEALKPLEMDSDGVPLAWILQVVSVSSKDKADEIRRRLLDMNHKAYVKKVIRKGKVLYRVYLGPKFERAKLEKLQSRINQEFSVTTMVVRYIP